jgi:hypothetical protein
MNFLKNLVMSFYFDSNRVAAGYIQKPDTGCTLKRLTLGRSAHPYLNVDFERSCTKAICRREVCK